MRAHGLRQTAEGPQQGRALLSDGQGRPPEGQGEKEDLQHIALGQSLDGVGGDNPQQGVRQRERGGLLPGGGERIAQLPPHRKQVGRQQAQGHRQRGGAQVEQEGAAADPAHVPGVPQTAHPRRQGAEHQGNHQHLYQIEKQGAEGLNPGRGKLRGILERQPGQHAQPQAQQDPERKGQLASHAPPPFPTRIWRRGENHTEERPWSTFPPSRS